MQNTVSHIRLTTDYGFGKITYAHRLYSSTLTKPEETVNPFVTAGAASENPGDPAVSNQVIQSRFRLMRYSVVPAKDSEADFTSLPQEWNLLRSRKTVKYGQPRKEKKLKI